MKQTIIICGVVALVVSLSITLLMRSKVIVEKRVETRVEQGERGDTPLGATPGAVIDSKYLSIGGVERYYEKQNVSASSSVLCFTQNPFNATSTLISWTMRITRGVLGNNTFDLSTTSVDFRFGSSTPALIYAKTLTSAVTANASTSWSAVWKPSATTTRNETAASATAGVDRPMLRNVIPSIRPDGSSNIVVNPGEYITARLATSSAGVFADQFLGQCTAVFERL